MKKLLVCLFAATLLAGCGGNAEPVKETKVCTDNSDGVPMEFTLNATDNEIDSMGVKVTVADDYSELTEEEKTAGKEALFAGIGLDPTWKGIEANVDFTAEAAVIDIKIDLANAEETALELFELDSFLIDKKLDSNVKSFEEDGATCK